MIVMAAQGDVLFRRVDAVPAGAVLQPRTERVVVAHSETGHHHALTAPGIDWYTSPDPLVGYLSLADPTEVRHERPWDTHAPLCLAPGVWEVRRQREYTPEGFRRVED